VPVWAILAIAWFAVGAVAVPMMHRRGHDTFVWAIVFVVLGPLAVPLAVSAERHPPPEASGPIHEGRLDVLVAHDGSPEAWAALDAALALVGGQLTSLTIADVVDLEAVTTVRGRETEQEAKARLEEVAARVAAETSAPIDTVVLHGVPAHALHEFAAQRGYELIVAGSRKRGAPRRLTARSSVPVLIGPTAE
jgi:nucleotide-binding universal stress UspA family protein